MQFVPRHLPRRRAWFYWFGLCAILLHGFVLKAGPPGPATNIPPFKIVSFSFQSNLFSVTINSATGCVYTLQSLDGLPGYWSEITNQMGNGAAVSCSDQPGGSARFYRVAAAPAGTLALFPSLPLLSSGAVSLPDATVGVAYAFDVSPALTGAGPYDLEFSNALPQGISAAIINNHTANALARLTSTGTNLVDGQRGQIILKVTDATGTNLNRSYDLRVVAPGPQILSSQIVLKAGAATNALLQATNGTGALSWALLSGPVPKGVSFSSNGSFNGTPTPDAAELNEDGLYTDLLQAADSFTDRVTGRPKPRVSVQNVVTVVRLSYRLNLLTNRLNGPAFGVICTQCHDSSFPPDFSSNSALAVIHVYGTGGACSPFWQYVRPGLYQSSLIYRKVADAPCGQRMPFGGPYFNDITINRIARWINELTDGDAD